MGPMGSVPDRLRPLLDASSPVQELARLLTDDGSRVLPRRRQRARRVPRPRDPRRRARRRRRHHRRAARRGRAARAPVGRSRVAAGSSGSEPSGASADGVRIEITTFRAEVYRPESRKPEVVFSDDIATDLSRRDFTVNAMALRLPDPELVDPFGGAADLAARRLRTPLAPEVSFVDDPLRMLRAARFVAQFDLVPDPALVAAIEALRHRLEIVSAERIRDELSKLLLVDDPSGRAVVPRRDRPRRRVPPRAQRDAARAGPDPHAQGRARAHDRGRAQHPTGAAGSPRRAVPRRRQAEDALVRERRGQLPSPRGGRRPHGRGTASGAEVPERRRRRRRAARVPPSPDPHVRDGLDRQGGAALRARRRAPARRAQPPAALRLHDPQPEPGPRPRSGGWTSSRRGSPSCASRRSSTPSARRSTAGR